VFFIGEVLEDTFWGCIFQNSGAYSFFHCRVGVVKCKKESPECAGANFTKPLCTLNSDGGVGLLSNSFNKHELALRSEICNGEQRTRPHSFVFVEKASVEERQQTFCFQVGDLFWVVGGFFAKDVE